MDSAKNAVVYFSVTGHTEAVAERLAGLLGVQAQRIIAAEPYSDVDIDYNSDCRANREQQDDLSARPEMAAPTPDIASASVVYVGYPIWWGKAPRIVLTFLENEALDGKTIVPFCTSGSSSIEGSLGELEAAAPNATFKPGRRFDSSVGESTLQEFAAQV